MAGTPQYIVDARGHKKAVVMDIDEYDEMVEDLESLALIADAKKKPVTSFEEIKRKLKEHGRI